MSFNHHFYCYILATIIIFIFDYNVFHPIFLPYAYKGLQDWAVNTCSLIPTYCPSQQFLVLRQFMTFSLSQEIITFFASVAIFFMSASCKTYKNLILISVSPLLIIALVDRDVFSITDIPPSPLFACIFLIWADRSLISSSFSMMQLQRLCGYRKLDWPIYTLS